MTTSSQSLVTIEGEAILTAQDFLLPRAVRGCTTPTSTGTAPCLFTTPALPQSLFPFITIQGIPVVIDTLVGVASGVPPGTYSVVTDTGNCLVSVA